ncbi:flippase [Lacrimispora sp.]|jgi:O-antigen/teichoic acid export membrane protein|uniref:flippase n=1 Tax=Lacrimispora sp. TaxID=2719234 RepID=UPI0028B12314|nr:flippase [Lacrimispora sp.]
MQKEKSLKFNFVMNSLLTVSSIIFPLITFPYVSRILLPEGNGRVSFASSVIAYFTMIAQLGIPTYGVRACAKKRNDKEELSRTVHELFIINIIMSLFVYFIFACSLYLVPQFREEKTLFLITSSTILFNSIGVEWLYKGLEQYTYITTRSIIFKFIALIATFLLIHQQSDYEVYAAISIFAASASNILNFFNAHKYIIVKPVGNYHIKQHLKPVYIFFAMSCATTIYTNLDTVMLGFLMGNIEVGYYNAAIKIKTILVSVVTSLGVVMLPRASYYVEQGMNAEFMRINKKAINFVILAAMPIMLYFISFAREGIFFLSGNEFEASILPMQIIMPTLLFIGLTNIMGIQMLVPLGKEKIVLYSVIAGACVNLVINFILIPRMASCGAAIGTLIAEMVVWIVQYMALRNVVGEIYKSLRYAPIIIALVLGSISSLWVKSLPLIDFFKLVITSLLFFGVYVFVLIVFKEPLIVEMGRFIVRRIFKNKMY